MRFRAGLVIGFATGFYAGAMAGHERYEQINQMLARIRGSETFDAASDKAKAVVDLGVERARDIVETTFNRDAQSGQPVPAGPPANGPGAAGISGRAPGAGGDTSP